ncbi:hypothetical protein B7P33_17455 [Sediminicola luteus]|uniref:Uncharacterized protein n=1 Tax=Sediminicola luteus TaxID=319238 RepID=A0A2A4G255_9FLAO|nr:hypothetical protein B7P33_17455 [Sediminicola luteus]
METLDKKIERNFSPLEDLKNGYIEGLDNELYSETYTSFHLRFIQQLSISSEAIIFRSPLFH